MMGGSFTISYKFAAKMENKIWCSTRVYGPIINVERSQFWEELAALRGLWREPWCLGGDFKVVRSPT